MTDSSTLASWSTRRRRGGTVASCSCWWLQGGLSWRSVSRRASTQLGNAPQLIIVSRSSLLIVAVAACALRTRSHEVERGLEACDSCSIFLLHFFLKDFWNWNQHIKTPVFACTDTIELQKNSIEQELDNTILNWIMGIDNNVKDVCVELLFTWLVNCGQS